MNKELVYACLALIFIASIAYGAYQWGQRNQRDRQFEEIQIQVDKKVKELDTAYLLAIEQKEKVIQLREFQIAKLKKEYQDLVDRLRIKAEQARAVKLPDTEAETRQRLEGLGYKPK